MAGVSLGSYRCDNASGVTPIYTSAVYKLIIYSENHARFNVSILVPRLFNPSMMHTQHAILKGSEWDLGTRIDTY